jgi:PAS domain S-box-containing protein
MDHSDSKPNRNISDYLNDTPTISDTPSSDELAALRAIVEGTARHTGQEFFQSLVRHLAAAVGMRYAFVAVFAGSTKARTLAFWFRDRIADNYEWDVVGTPCEDVVRGNLCHYASGVSQRFPGDERSVGWGIESYLGVPLCDAQGRHLGHLAVFDERPMPAEPRKLFIFHIFADRVAAELERSQYEERLRESEQRWRSLTEALPQLVWSATPDGACDYLSTQWTQHTGVPESDLLGWRWLEMLHPDDRDPTRRLWTDSVAGRGPYDVEYRVRRSDGVYRWFKTRGTPLRDSQGRIFKWFGTCTDITDAKVAAEELRLAKDTAEAANRAKDEFLANVSHEIRTPMNAILGMTELALDTELADDQRQYLTTVKSAADALLGIINDLLDFAKIEAGRLELDLADFSLASLLGATLRAMAVRAHKKGLELVCHQQPDVPDALIGDAGRLRQVLLNLVGNALKFTEKGEVVVLVENAGQPAPEGALRLRFAVTDTGIGIPPEKQTKIFQAFEQEDTSTTRKYGGTGLGLTIAARLVALMGGTLTVDSAPGRGSTFAFTARFGLPPHPPETTPAAPPAVLRGLPVLIVDDNATNRHILAEWLRGDAMEPTAAGDGVTAMAALWRGVAQGRPYPLALLDGRMPDIDGLALAAKIRQQAELSATRLILLTSGDRPGDLTRARQLGISANLLKPLQQGELRETLRRVMGLQGDPEELLVSRPGVRPPIPAGRAGVALRILAAEDNDFNRDLLEHMLARMGLSAAMAVNGREALALLEREPFDLLLLDIHMPELDGFGVVGALRERERMVGGHLPVIALTARSRQEDRERCLRAGMDACLTKPYSAADLGAAMDRVLRREEGRGMRDEGLDSSLLPPPSSLDASRPLLDAPVLLAACGGDPAMLGKMCRALQARIPEHLAAIRDALHAQDARRVREAAHKFYGMLSAFSTVVGDQAAILEDLAARGLLPQALAVVEQLDHDATELARLAGALTIETLRKQPKPADDPNRTASP